MIELEHLTEQIKLISGVESYALVRRNGEVVFHNLRDPDDLASMISISGIGADTIKRKIGFSQFRFLTFNRVDKRTFMIFFLNQYFLGIQQIAGSDDQRLAAEICRLLE